MKIIECGDKTNVTVEFQDEHKARVHTQYTNFQKGSVKNPYYPSICGVGIIGEKYPVSTNCITAKEYDAWRRMIVRCFNEWYKENRPAYKFVTVCDEWLNYENYYEWIHSQENFEHWYNGKRWAIDKDILNKGNKIYSPENCCLIPQNVNCLFLKREAERGKYPIGVRYTENGFLATCRNPFLDKALYPFWKSCTLCLKQIQASTVKISLAQVYGIIALIKTKLCSIVWGPLPV